jgi:hypothetical protein
VSVRARASQGNGCRASACSLSSQCPEGHDSSSPLCSRCLPGFSLTLFGGCEPCTETSSGLVVALVLVTWGVVALLLMCAGRLRAALSTA